LTPSLAKISGTLAVGVVRLLEPVIVQSNEYESFITNSRPRGSLPAPASSRYGLNLVEPQREVLYELYSPFTGA